MKALSIQQPWAWLIVSGRKDIENRDWLTRYRGPVLIHAGKRTDADAFDSIRHGEHPVSGERSWLFAALEEEGQLPVGGIVGEAEIVDCVTHHGSPWFVGRFGFVIRNARPLPFQPCRGQLGFFEPDLTPVPAVQPKSDLFSEQGNQP